MHESSELISKSMESPIKRSRRKPFGDSISRLVRQMSSTMHRPSLEMRSTKDNRWRKDLTATFFLLCAPSRRCCGVCRHLVVVSINLISTMAHRSNETRVRRHTLQAICLFFVLSATRRYGLKVACHVILFRPVGQ